MSKTKEERAAEYAVEVYPTASDVDAGLSKKMMFHAARRAFLNGADWMASIKDKEIEELKDQLQWRSVEEELPKDAKEYLVVDKYGIKYKVYYARPLTGVWIMKIPYSDDEVVIQHVVGWLPIPRKEEQ